MRGLARAVSQAGRLHRRRRCLGEVLGPQAWVGKVQGNARDGQLAALTGDRQVGDGNRIPGKLRAVTFFMAEIGLRSSSGWKGDGGGLRCESPRNGGRLRQSR